MSTAVGERTRPYPIACAVATITEVVKGRPADGLMGARGTVLPGAERRFSNTIGRSAQVRSGTGIEVGASHTVARHARSIAEIIEICLANGLFRSADVIEVVEGGLADVGAGAGLGEGHTGDQKKKENKESHRAPPTVILSSSGTEVNKSGACVSARMTASLALLRALAQIAGSPNPSSSQ